MTILAPRSFEVGDDGVAVESLVGDQRAEGQAIDERRHADGVEAVSWQQDEAHEIAEGIGEGQDFGGHAAFGAADGLALSPPFEPCPWRWTLTMVASTMAYSISGSSEQASKSRTKTSALTQSRYRLNTLFQLPKQGRQVAPGTSRPYDPEHRLDETAVVAPASSGVRRLAQTMRFHLRPLGIRQNESFHPKLESRSASGGNL